MNVKDSNWAYGSQRQTKMADNSVIYLVISLRLGIYIGFLVNPLQKHTWDSKSGGSRKELKGTKNHVILRGAKWLYSIKDSNCLRHRVIDDWFMCLARDMYILSWVSDINLAYGIKNNFWQITAQTNWVKFQSSIIKQGAHKK